MVVIVGVDVLQEGVDKFSAVAGEDPVVVGVEEDHVQIDSWHGWSGSPVASWERPRATFPRV